MKREKRLERTLAEFRDAVRERWAIGCPARFFLDQYGILRWEQLAFHGSERVQNWAYAYLDEGGSRRRLAATQTWARRKAQLDAVQ